MERAANLDDVRKRWEKYGLPEDMVGKSFFDIGCWAGGFCKVAVQKGAVSAIGIDSVPSPYWSTFQHPHIQYLIMDAFNPNFLGLPFCDVVLCAGVLYHVSDPVGLLRRLRMKTGELCVLDTVITTTYPFPYLRYCPDNSFDDNSSNWFLPNEAFLRAIMPEVGFEILKTIKDGDRLCMHLIPSDRATAKLLPRKPQFMKS